MSANRSDRGRTVTPGQVTPLSPTLASMSPASPRDDDGPALVWAARKLGADTVRHRELTGGKTRAGSR